MRNQLGSLLRAVVSVAAAIVTLSPLRASETPNDLKPVKDAVVRQYAALVSASYDDALDGARNLAASIDGFLAAPSAASMAAARQAWIDARVPYAQTEAYRFYDGPIDALDGLINAWPIDENLIDYVEGEPDAGIVNQPTRFPVITADLVVSLNEKGGEKNITTGFHAIEFLLWGQDVNDDGPGQRPFTDYVVGQETHAQRRREYLRVVTALLIVHLERLKAEWSPDASNYRSRLLTGPADVALAHILQGLGILSGAELAGERLTVAFETKEQEDEHSCFSDNTQRDLLNDAIGVKNVFIGAYPRRPITAEGTSLRDLLQRVDANLAVTLSKQIDASVRAAEMVPAPFDRAVQGTDAAPGRVAVRRLITALRAQSDSIALAGKALGVQLSF